MLLDEESVYLDSKTRLSFEVFLIALDHKPNHPKQLLFPASK